MIQSIVIKCMLHNKLIIAVMLCYFQDILVNVYLLLPNTSIQQFTRTNKTTMVILTSLLYKSQVCRNLSTRGDKHTIHDNRRATCHCRMRTFHPTKTGVAQIARSDPLEVRSRFPVVPVHNIQYGCVELLMRFEDPITSNTTAGHRILRKFNFFNSFTRCLLALDTRHLIRRITNRTRTE